MTTPRQPIRKSPPSLPELKKGDLVVLKTPPLYDRDYLYEIVSAGKTQLRASLYHSPKVRRTWSHEEAAAMFTHGVLRVATDKDIAELTAKPSRTGR